MTFSNYIVRSTHSPAKAVTASADFARISRSDLLDTELDKPETQFADAEILFRYAKYKGYRMADETD